MPIGHEIVVVANREENTKRDLERSKNLSSAAITVQQVEQRQQAVDVDTVKIGRGRWWLMPAIVLVVGAVFAIALLH